MYHAGHRVLATGRRQAVHHQVHLAQVFLDGGDSLLLDLIAEGIAVDAFGVEAVRRGERVKRRAVVPAGGARLGLAAFLFEENTQGSGTGTESGRDTRGQAITGGRTDHQHPLRAVGDGAAGFHIVNLAFDIGRTANRVSGNAEKSANAWLDYHGLVIPGCGECSVLARKHTAWQYRPGRDRSRPASLAYRPDAAATRTRPPCVQRSLTVQYQPCKGTIFFRTDIHPDR